MREFDAKGGDLARTSPAVIAPDALDLLVELRLFEPYRRRVNQR